MTQPTPSISLAQLISAARERQGTPEQRQAEIRERAARLNQRINEELEALRLTGELLERSVNL